MITSDINAERAYVILTREYYRDDAESSALEMLIGIMHLCDRESLDFDAMLQHARKTHLEQVRGDV